MYREQVAEHKRHQVRSDQFYAFTFYSEHTHIRTRYAGWRRVWGTSFPTFYSILYFILQILLCFAFVLSVDKEITVVSVGFPCSKQALKELSGTGSWLFIGLLVRSCGLPVVTRGRLRYRSRLGTGPNPTSLDHWVWGYRLFSESVTMISIQHVQYSSSSDNVFLMIAYIMNARQTFSND